MPDLLLERGLLANKKLIASWCALVPRLELLEQVRGNSPPLGSLRDGEPLTLQLQQPSRVRVRRAVGRRLGRVASATRRGRLRDLAVDSADSWLASARERDDVARTQLLRRARVDWDVVGVPGWRLENHVERTLELVRETLARHSPHVDEGLVRAVHVDRLPHAHDPVTRTVSSGGHVNLLQNVASGAELTEVLLPPRAERPRSGAHALGEPEAFEVLQPGDE